MTLPLYPPACRLSIEKPSYRRDLMNSATVTFILGQIVATRGALQALAASSQNPLEFLSRHARGDWGELCVEDREQNALALREGYRLMSAYTLGNGEKLWIITESDRSVTTLLLPQEY
jgi:hypothetical protein